jgi:hypothetical protein
MRRARHRSSTALMKAEVDAVNARVRCRRTGFRKAGVLGERRAYLIRGLRVVLFCSSACAFSRARRGRPQARRASFHSARAGSSPAGRAIRPHSITGGPSAGALDHQDAISARSLQVVADVVLDALPRIEARLNQH